MALEHPGGDLLVDGTWSSATRIRILDRPVGGGAVGWSTGPGISGASGAGRGAVPRSIIRVLNSSDWRTGLVR